MRRQLFLACLLAGLCLSLTGCADEKVSNEKKGAGTAAPAIPKTEKEKPTKQDRSTN